MNDLFQIGRKSVNGIAATEIAPVDEFEIVEAHVRLIAVLEGKHVMRRNWPIGRNPKQVMGRLPVDRVSDVRDLRYLGV